MFVSIVKTIKAFVLAYVASELILDAVKAIHNWITCRNEKKAWDDYLETMPPVEYDPVSHTAN